jgi:hypothetical protein
MSGNLLQPAP